MRRERVGFSNGYFWKKRLHISWSKFYMISPFLHVVLVFPEDLLHHCSYSYVWLPRLNPGLLFGRGFKIKKLKKCIIFLHAFFFYVFTSRILFRRRGGSNPVIPLDTALVGVIVFGSSLHQAKILTHLLFLVVGIWCYIFPQEINRSQGFVLWRQHLYRGHLTLISHWLAENIRQALISCVNGFYSHRIANGYITNPVACQEF